MNGFTGSRMVLISICQEQEEQLQYRKKGILQEDINVMEVNVFPVHKLIKADIGHWKREVGKVFLGKENILWKLKKEKKEIMYN